MASDLNRKRKQRTYDNRVHQRQPTYSDGPDPSLFIQAHEADVVHGIHGAAAAQSLEIKRGESYLPGDGLIRWDRQGTSDFLEDEPVRLSGGSPQLEVLPKDGTAIWVDRYDARLLLEALPDLPRAATEPSSPDGWSDLPSDTEDTFFFSAIEAEDYRREKRRRLINGDREARLRAMRDEAGDEDVEPEDEWGGSDEEPDEIQRELMRRTASHVLSSPNPAQLEMRILANHGADQRFAFLRGRWSRVWRLTKAKQQSELEGEKRQEGEDAKKAGIGGLVEYGDSGDEEEPDALPPPSNEEPASQSGGIDVAETVDTEQDDTVKAARRARAREWAEQRRALKASGGTQAPGQSQSTSS